MTKRDWEARMIQRLKKECDCSLGTPHTQERAVRIVVEEAFDGALAAVGNPEGLPKVLKLLLNRHPPHTYDGYNDMVGINTCCETSANEPHKPDCYWLEDQALIAALQIDEENLP